MTLKVLSLYEKNIQVAVGEYISPIEFQLDYRVQSIMANNIPDRINQQMDRSLVSNLFGSEFMLKKIKEAPRKVTFLLTGPMSHVAKALEID